MGTFRSSITSNRPDPYEVYSSEATSTRSSFHLVCKFPGSINVLADFRNTSSIQTKVMFSDRRPDFQVHHRHSPNLFQLGGNPTSVNCAMNWNSMRSRCPKDVISTIMFNTTMINLGINPHICWLTVYMQASNYHLVLFQILLPFTSESWLLHFTANSFQGICCCDRGDEDLVSHCILILLCIPIHRSPTNSHGEDTEYHNPRSWRGISVNFTPYEGKIKPENYLSIYS